MLLNYFVIVGSLYNEIWLNSNEQIYKNEREIIMAINEIQTNVNQSTAYPVMQSEIKATDTTAVDTATEQDVSKNNTDTFTLSNGTEEATGIYSPDTASINSTNATSSNISGTSSIISKATPHNIVQKKSHYKFKKRTAKFTLTCLQRQT